MSVRCQQHQAARTRALTWPNIPPRRMTRIFVVRWKHTASYSESAVTKQVCLQSKTICKTDWNAACYNAFETAGIASRLHIWAWFLFFAGGPCHAEAGGANTTADSVWNASFPIQVAGHNHLLCSRLACYRSSFLLNIIVPSAYVNCVESGLATLKNVWQKY